jgi:hypothetical protein
MSLSVCKRNVKESATHSHRSHSKDQELPQSGPHPWHRRFSQSGGSTTKLTVALGSDSENHSDAEAMFDHPAKQYALFQGFEEKLNNRDIDSLPQLLHDKPHARAYYGSFKLVLGEEYFTSASEEDINTLAGLALDIDHLVEQAVTEHSLNPQSIEASITKGLLPMLFKPMGMDKAKAVIEKIIHITRVGLSGRHKNQ